nr:MAG TPA: hypothetical protein [Caudoviricetes sp.]
MTSPPFKHTISLSCFDVKCLIYFFIRHLYNVNMTSKGELAYV